MIYLNIVELIHYVYIHVHVHVQTLHVMQFKLIVSVLLYWFVCVSWCAPEPARGSNAGSGTEQGPLPLGWIQTGGAFSIAVASM